jgi:hypothetical protein
MGHDAWSCDLLPADDGSEHHIQGDAIDALMLGPPDLYRVDGDSHEWDLVIAHPPCTRLCNSGVRWLHERNLWDELDAACEFFRYFLDSASRCAVENPIPHKYAVKRIGRKPDQYIQPWQFGHGETKKTGLWLHNLPPLRPTNVVAGRDARIHKMPPGPERWKARSKTYQGIADAMADQWGSLNSYPKTHGGHDEGV